MTRSYETNPMVYKHRMNQNKSTKHWNVLFHTSDIFLVIHHSPSGHPRCRWVCLFIETMKCSVPSLAHQWILCSEWVPSEEGLLWIIKSAFRPESLLMDLFLTNTQDVNWCTGVVWIIVMFLSAVWTLFLTAPIHYRASIGDQVMKCYISPNLFQWRNNSKSLKCTVQHVCETKYEKIYIFENKLKKCIIVYPLIQK